MKDGHDCEGTHAIKCPVEQSRVIRMSWCHDWIVFSHTDVTTSFDVGNGRLGYGDLKIPTGIPCGTGLTSWFSCLRFKVEVNLNKIWQDVSAIILYFSGRREPDPVFKPPQFGWRCGARGNATQLVHRRCHTIPVCCTVTRVIHSSHLHCRATAIAYAFLWGGVVSSRRRWSSFWFLA